MLNTETQKLYWMKILHTSLSTKLLQLHTNKLRPPMHEPNPVGQNGPCLAC